MKARACQARARFHSTARSRSENSRRVKIAEKRVALCMQRLVKAALAVDRALAERGDDQSRHKVIEGALRLTKNV